MSSDESRNTLYTIHPYASAPEMPRERLDMSRCITYALGMTFIECRDAFKKHYGIEPVYASQRKFYGWTLGMIPKDWREDDGSGEVENSSDGAEDA